jgi:hypothetical protein
MTKICLTIALTASLASEVAGQVKEREYRGKTISEWLSTPRQGTLSDEAKQAILEAGTNSLPFLIEATQGRLWRPDEPNTELQVSNWMQQVNRRWNAIEALLVLGHQAAPAIPELLRLSKEAALEHQRGEYCHPSTCRSQWRGALTSIPSELFAKARTRKLRKAGESRKSE